MTKTFTRVDDYVSGHLDDAEAAEFEERLFERAAAGRHDDEIRAFDGLAHQLREAGRRGLMQISLTREDAERYMRDTENVAVSEITELVTEKIEVDPHKTSLLTRFALDLTDVKRLDLEVHFDEVGLVKTMPDLTFDAESGSVYMFCDINVAMEAGDQAHRVTTRFVAVSDNDERRTLADFRVGRVVRASTA